MSRPKRYHLVDKIRADGAASALCFDPPRAIALSRASWTILTGSVNCPKCLRLIASGKTSRVVTQLDQERIDTAYRRRQE